MAEVPNRLDAMTKGNIGIAMVEVHTASVGYELDGSRRRDLVEYLQRSDHEFGQASSRPLCRHRHRTVTRPAPRG